MSSVSRFLMLANENVEAIRLGHEALAMAEHLGLDELRAQAMNNIGTATWHSGDSGGVEDLKRSLAIATSANAPAAICRAMGNLGVLFYERGQLTQALVSWEEAAETASRFGQVEYGRWMRASRPWAQYALGNWDEAQAAASALIMEVEAGSPWYFTAACYEVRALIRVSRGDVPGAVADIERAVDLVRVVKDPQELYPALASAAHVYRESGDRQRASALAKEFLAEMRSGRRLSFGVVSIHMLAWTLAALGQGPDLVEALPNSDMPWVRAALTFAAGDLRRAADICGEMGAVTEEARVRLWLARELVEQNRRAEADVELGHALAFYRSVGATRYIREGEALLAASA